MMGLQNWVILPYNVIGSISDSESLRLGSNPNRAVYQIAVLSQHCSFKSIFTRVWQKSDSSPFQGDPSRSVTDHPFLYDFQSMSYKRQRFLIALSETL